MSLENEMNAALAQLDDLARRKAPVDARCREAQRVVNEAKHELSLIEDYAKAMNEEKAGILAAIFEIAAAQVKL